MTLGGITPVALPVSYAGRFQSQFSAMEEAADRTAWSDCSWKIPFLFLFAQGFFYKEVGGNTNFLLLYSTSTMQWMFSRNGLFTLFFSNSIRTRSTVIVFVIRNSYRYHRPG